MLTGSPSYIKSAQPIFTGRSSSKSRPGTGTAFLRFYAAPLSDGDYDYHEKGQDMFNSWQGDSIRRSDVGILKAGGSPNIGATDHSSIKGVKSLLAQIDYFSNAGQL